MNYLHIQYNAKNKKFSSELCINGIHYTFFYKDTDMFFISNMAQHMAEIRVSEINSLNKEKRGKQNAKTRSGKHNAKN